MKKTKLAVTLTTTALLTAQSSAQTPLRTQPSAPASAGEIAGMSKEELKTQLANTEGTSGTGNEEEVITLTCYFTISPVERSDYVCAVCGERTTLAADGEGKDLAAIEECRRLLGQLPATAGIKLVETQYCRKCTPKCRHPSLELLVPRTHGQARTIHHITNTDLRGMIDYCKALPTEQAKMRKDSRRLRKLLGL